MRKNKPSLTVRERGLLRALLYSDIFHFPLTRDELFRFSQTDTFWQQSEISPCLKDIASYISQKDGFFCLRGQEAAISKRQENSLWQEQKLQLGKRMARLLSYVPTVLFIGISGAVAAGNAKEDDDIDFFVITADKTLWITRLLVLCLLQLAGKRRLRDTIHARNMICLNMLCEESKIRFPEERHDLYTARECVQMLPVFTRGDTYSLFLKQNTWISGFFANGYSYLSGKKPKERKRRQLFIKIIGNGFAEKVASGLQRRIMAKHRTTETIKTGFLALHPRDYRQGILAKFEAKLRATGY